MWTIHVSIGNGSREPESIRRDQMASEDHGSRSQNNFTGLISMHLMGEEKKSRLGCKLTGI